MESIRLSKEGPSGSSVYARVEAPRWRQCPATMDTQFAHFLVRSTATTRRTYLTISRVIRRVMGACPKSAR